MKKWNAEHVNGMKKRPVSLQNEKLLVNRTSPKQRKPVLQKLKPQGSRKCSSHEKQHNEPCQNSRPALSVKVLPPQTYRFRSCGTITTTLTCTWSVLPGSEFTVVTKPLLVVANLTSTPMYALKHASLLKTCSGKMERHQRVSTKSMFTITRSTRSDEVVTQRSSK